MSELKYELNAQEQVLVLFDALTGKTVKFFCRTPGTDEKIEYKSQYTDLAQKDKKLVFKYQLEVGEKLITGFEDDYFVIDGKPISSNVEDTQQKYDEAFSQYQKELESYNKLSDVEKANIQKPLFNKGIYYPGWYAVLKAKRPEMIWNCVDYMFGTSSLVLKGEQLPFVRS